MPRGVCTARSKTPTSPLHTVTSSAKAVHRRQADRKLLTGPLRARRGARTVLREPGKGGCRGVH